MVIVAGVAVGAVVAAGVALVTAAVALPVAVVVVTSVSNLLPSGRTSHLLTLELPLLHVRHEMHC